VDAEVRPPLVWVTAPVSRAARETALRWAAAHGVMATPGEDGPAPALPWDAVDAAERDVAAAREAILGQDAGRAEQALARAEATLRAAPELPVAAWIMAEVHRAWAARFASVEPRDSERAARAWERAEALDGGRAPGVGEPGPPVFAGSGAREGYVVRARLLLDGPNAGATIAVDGAPRDGSMVDVARGEHHVRVVRGEAVAFAGWLTFDRDGDVLRVALAPPSPCSRPDLEPPVAPRCASWVRARALPDGVELARCAATICGAPVRVPFTLAVSEPASERRWPAWATWTLVGAGALGGAVAVLAAAGAFAGPPPAETRFIGGGVRPASFP